MRRYVVQLAVLTGALVLGIVPVTRADINGQFPDSIGVVATITSIDASHDLATVQTDAGEVFTLPTGWHWHVGDKLECNRAAIAPPQGPQLLDCKPWQ